MIGLFGESWLKCACFSFWFEAAIYVRALSVELFAKNLRAFAVILESYQKMTFFELFCGLNVTPRLNVLHQTI